MVVGLSGLPEERDGEDNGHVHEIMVIRSGCFAGLSDGWWLESPT